MFRDDACSRVFIRGIEELIGKRSRPRWHVHDNVAQMEETFRRQRFGKEISDVLIGSDKGHTYLSPLDSLSNEDMPAFDVFSALMMFWIIREINGTLIIH